MLIVLAWYGRVKLNFSLHHADYDDSRTHLAGQLEAAKDLELGEFEHEQIAYMIHVVHSYEAIDKVNTVASKAS